MAPQTSEASTPSTVSNYSAITNEANEHRQLHPKLYQWEIQQVLVKESKQKEKAICFINLLMTMRTLQHSHDWKAMIIPNFSNNYQFTCLSHVIQLDYIEKQ